MNLKMKKYLIIITGIIITGIFTSSLVIHKIIDNTIPKSYGSISIAFQIKEKNNTDIIIETTGFTTLRVCYNEIERKMYDKHLEYVYEIPDRWKTGDYTIEVLYRNDTIRKHYWVVKIDEKILITFKGGLLSNGTGKLPLGNIFNFSAWEFFTGPDPKIGE